MTPRALTAERRCIVTRRSRPKADLLRFVRGPDSELVFDLKKNLPGRGVWVSVDRSLVDAAIKKGLFSRAFKSEIRIASDFVTSMEAGMRASALGSLGLARKAGQVILGFASVEAALTKGEVEVLVHASDGADDGRRKLAAALRRAGDEAATPHTVTMFTASELSLALGRPNVIHAAVRVGHGAASFLDKTLLVARFCADGVDDRLGSDVVPDIPDPPDLRV